MFPVLLTVLFVHSRCITSVFRVRLLLTNQRKRDGSVLFKFFLHSIFVKQLPEEDLSL
jgi:hypothetical protein